MPLVKVEIEVFCGRCGKGLCRQSEGGDGKVTVEPCGYCEEAEYDSGYDKGYETGYEEAKNEFSN